MLHYIEIRSESLPLITKLNNGVTPQIQDELTFFVFDPDVDGAQPYIATLTEVEKTVERIDRNGVIVIPVVMF